MKEDQLVRVSFPAEMIAAARELGKPEHASVAQVCRRALQKELERMQQKQVREARKRLQQERDLSSPNG